jgi:hypothetical protein
LKQVYIHRQLALSEASNINMSAIARSIKREAPELLADESRSDAAPKRQRLDDTITLDDQYDLTLVVGKNVENGVKNFRVNRSSLRLASAPFKTMLDGRFAESDQSEIEFPDDSWFAFHVFLLVTHMKIEELPGTMRSSELLCLTQFCDKYDLGSLLSPFVIAKGWLSAHKTEGSWKLHERSMAFLFVAHTFKMDTDCASLTAMLALQLQVHEDGSMFFVHSEKRIRLRGTFCTERLMGKLELPNFGIVAKVFPDSLRHTRSAYLEEILTRCNRALEASLKKKRCPGGPGCNVTCAAFRVGVIVHSLNSLGLFPALEDTSQMRKSVTAYRDGLNAVKTLNEAPFRKLHGKDSNGHPWNKCVDDTGVFAWN